ncbi:hypothetical protein Nepgr_030814 [Nepenthes gracilis]|uniref:Uncharacterized protein n=1 Tax=Nepenthes gracilis TaxID=150966 RepID=A0AAD3THB4_NEPGR|nr:hypothetical protein Nepgr_030814 [Nepenthes gracilis]
MIQWGVVGGSQHASDPGLLPKWVSMKAAPSIANLGRGIQSLQLASLAVRESGRTKIQNAMESLMYRFRKALEEQVKKEFSFLLQSSLEQNADGNKVVVFFSSGISTIPVFSMTGMIFILPNASLVSKRINKCDSGLVEIMPVLVLTN